MISYGRQPVGNSADLNRVIAISRRDLYRAHTAGALMRLEHQLRIETPTRCVCAQQGRECPTSLKLIQGYALLEAPLAGGLLGRIGTGHGKTLIDLLLAMVMPGCRVAALFIQADLLSQFLDRDVPYYGGHWHIPNVVPGSQFVSGRPALHVYTYNKLSSQDASDLLRRLKPDLIILDEAQNLKDPKAARTIRFLRQFAEETGTRLCAQSGTLDSRSIRDAAHLGALALGDDSPYPRDHHSIEEWAGAIDPCTCPAAKVPGSQCLCRAHPGALLRLCEPGEHVRDGFRRRTNETRGVVSTSESAIGTQLIIRRRMPGPVPGGILAAIDEALKGTRPDGDRFQEKLQGAACARQLASGFYHRWRYPRGEPAELIDEWFIKRKAFNSEVWDALKRPEEGLDSPGLLIRAAERWVSGYEVRSGHTHDGTCYDSLPEDEWERHEHGVDCTDPLCISEWKHTSRLVCEQEEQGDVTIVPPHSRRGPLPVWESLNWVDWRDIRHKVQPVPEAVWVSDYVVDDAARWARETRGIVWVEFPELGQRIADRAKVPFYGGGTEASATICNETGKRSIVASIRAHCTGKNLQMFHRNLIVTPPSDGARCEQLIARTHRPGQLASCVEVEVNQQTDNLAAAFAQAQEFARFIQATSGQAQKLLLATPDDSWL